jgi:glycine/serine hydroxymethyltransferase
MGEAEMTKIASMIVAIVNEPESDEVRQNVRKEVAELTVKFPLYPLRMKNSPEREAMVAD